MKKNKIGNGFPECNFIKNPSKNQKNDVALKFGQFSKSDLINAYIDLAENNGVDFNENYIWGIRKRREIVSLLKRDFSNTNLRIELTMDEHTKNKSLLRRGAF